MLHRLYLPYCQCVLGPESAAGIQGTVYFVHGFFQADEFLVKPFSVVGEFAYFLPDIFFLFFASHVHASRHKFFYIIYAQERQFVNKSGLILKII